MLPTRLLPGQSRDVTKIKVIECLLAQKSCTFRAFLLGLANTSSQECGFAGADIALDAKCYLINTLIRFAEA